MLYTLSIRIYGLFLAIAALFHPKAALWLAGRKNWEESLKQAIDPERPRIWFHCASLGEFEQARNLIETIRATYPHYQLILSFFSPSGYEVRKSYQHVDYVCYLPLDTPAHARMWVETLRPELVFVVNYELWLNVFDQLKEREIPLMLVSVRIRSQGAITQIIRRLLYRRGFAACVHIFAQDEQAAQMIRNISSNAPVSVSFDTRYDRVLSTKAAHQDIAEIASFKQDRTCIVCGSTWPKDETHIFAMYEQLRYSHDLCLVIAPHEIDQDRISRWMATFPTESIRFSHIQERTASHRILWIDNIGMLSRLYAYADIAYVGGAWAEKVHNILEAVVFGCPVLFGPNYHNLPEAPELIRLGGAYSVGNQSELLEALRILLEQDRKMRLAEEVNPSFVAERAGATDYILNWCKKAGYLTSAKPL